MAKIKRQMKDIIIRLNEDGETLLSPDYPMETNNDILREQDSFYYSMDNDVSTCIVYSGHIYISNCKKLYFYFAV